VELNTNSSTVDSSAPRLKIRSVGLTTERELRDKFVYSLFFLRVLSLTSFRLQNTLNIGSNQNVAGQPTTTYDSTGEAQDALVYTPANSSTAFMTADLSEMYNETSVSVEFIEELGFKLILLWSILSVCLPRYSFPQRSTTSPST